MTRISTLNISFTDRNARRRGPTSSEAWNDIHDELASDLAGIYSQWNNRLKPLTNTLPDGTGGIPDAFTNGLDGQTMYVKSDATNSDTTYYSSANVRPNTIYEQFAALYTYVDGINESLGNTIGGQVFSAANISVADNNGVLDSTDVEAALYELYTTISIPGDTYLPLAGGYLTGTLGIGTGANSTYALHVVGAANINAVYSKGSGTGKGGSFVGGDNGTGLYAAGGGLEAGVEGIGGTTDNSVGVYGTSGATNGIGVKGLGTGAYQGVYGTGGAIDGSVGIYGTSSATNGYGVWGEGVGSNSGTIGRSATDGVAGVYGTSSATNGYGIQGLGTGTGHGVVGTGGATDGSQGVYGTSSATNGYGLVGLGTGTNQGVYGTGGATDASVGVFGTSSATNGNGVQGVGTGTGYGIYGIAINGHGVIAESDTTTPTQSALRIVPQDTAPSTPAEGDIYVNSTTHKLEVYLDGGWREAATA